MRRHRIHHIGSVHVADSADSSSVARSSNADTCARGVAAPMVPLFCCSASFACGALTADCVATSGVRSVVHRGASAGSKTLRSMTVNGRNRSYNMMSHEFCGVPLRLPSSGASL